MKEYYGILAVALLMLVGCSSSESVSSLKVKDFQLSTCKAGMAENKAKTVVTRAGDDFDDSEIINYEAANDGNLLVTHVNALCGCDGAVTTTAEYDADTRTITITENDPHDVNCMCYMDIKTEIEGISDGNYTLVIKDGATLVTSIQIVYSKSLKGSKYVGGGKQ